MKKQSINILLGILILLLGVSCSSHKHFVSVSGTQFVHKKKPYYFIGANYWYGMNLGMKGEKGDRARLTRELDHMQELGITNLRILASSDGPLSAPWRVQPTLQPEAGVINEEVAEGLDFLLSEMAKRDMKAVMVLNNFWTWSGGMTQYLEWAGEPEAPYPFDGSNSWDAYIKYTQSFYQNEKAMQLFEDFLTKIINRENSITKRSYKEDGTIMAWQLSNEPRGYESRADYLKWIERTASFIKVQDQKHLVCLGTEGNTPGTNAGINVYEDNFSEHIDYMTMHIWVQNWSWFNPTNAEETYPTAFKNVEAYIKDHVASAQKLGKPIVLEEFGIGRDENNHDPKATTVWKDKYYKALFEKVIENAEQGTSLVGANFWAFAGEGRPKHIHDFWEEGDDYIGDPPHERQGWYSVYDQDTTTLNIISESAQKIQRLNDKKYLKEKSDNEVIDSPKEI
ncbi:glycoside hydrolase 5 family protein [Sediminitomix flava]|uniref:mannan endo-1,4-beta-mannosidase n=1 Tax=Sediminitomix flava TaxID=379075 RepID=A0A315ZHC0_SEDFL|nr:cellulase family glycosylhydrolase [Sediminitomix flava]PWJ44589.1 mannan endo-1,4-beta-mannosidase [Sediminitomix flava]